MLTEYNEGKQKIDMVLFNMALEHLTRINRVLKMDTGHILLIGVAGSGKTLMTKLAAFTAGMILSETDYIIMYFQREWFLCVLFSSFRL